MTKYTYAPNNNRQTHSSAWIVQVWLSFLLSISATTIGVAFLPVNDWIKGYLGMGLLFSIGSTISLSKTVRDVHESSKLLSRVDEAKLERILAEHDPFKK
ncbi:MAG TPA: YiaA/YiaB family inner membrane protein [Thermosynechococcaceae cyanobacterium]